MDWRVIVFFFFQAEDGIRDSSVTGVQTCALPIFLKEGRPRSSIFMVGNVMIDSLQHFLPIAQQSRIGDELGLKNGTGWRRFGVLTLHRPSNVDSTEKLSELLGAIDAVAAQMPVICPVHPRTH